ncbi:MAG TPA: porin family protein [Lacibacter sp.]|nr:porin family protein [Lacibacter sp.]
MKQFFAVFLCTVILTVASKAQDLTNILFGIKAGYNLHFSSFITTQKVPSNLFHGGYAGVMMKIPFDNRLSFTPHVDFNYRGTSTDSIQANQFSSIKEFQMRVMPLLQIDFKHPDDKSNTLFVHFGPAIEFGITGTQVKQDASNVKQSRSLHYGYQRYGRYDASWQTGIGYETTGGFRVLLNYAHGLGNMINTEGGGTIKYRTVSLGIGYWLGRK